jgi:hypothetical protein
MTPQRLYVFFWESRSCFFLVVVVVGGGGVQGDLDID